MAETPGLVAVTKFVRPGSKTFASYINYMDRDEAIKGGNVRASYSAYSEEYMGNPEKSTGLFSMDYDQLSADTAQIYKEQFQKAQDDGSLLWQTVISFDNKWLEELGIYDSSTQELDEARIQGMIRIFMKKLLDKEGLHLASWTAAIHYNTDNIHVHIAIVDPAGEREKVTDGKYVGEPKGTWSIRSIRYAKSAAVNELLDLDREMKQLNDLVRECIVKPLREHGQEEMLLQSDLEQLLAKLENEVPDFHKWKYGLADMKPYRSEVDRITSQWLQQVHPEEYKEIQKLWSHLQSQQERAYGSSSQKKSYQSNQEADLYRRCGNAILQTLRETEQQKRQWDNKQKTVSKRVRIGHGISRLSIRKLSRYFENSYQHYKNLAAYEYAQRQIKWQQQQEIQEEEAQIQEAIWLDQQT